MKEIGNGFIQMIICQYENSMENEDNHMILKDKYNTYQYTCNLTHKLDQSARFNERYQYCRYYKHYLLDYRDKEGFYNFPIRVPGRTVGWMWVDKYNKIVKISIDKDYAAKTYPDDLDEKLQKYIGEKIEFGR